MDVRLTAVYVADARLVAEGVAQPEDAMSVFVGPGGKGRVSPFTVRRSYTGAGGWYQELIVLMDPGGDVVWRSQERALALRGSNKIDAYEDVVGGAEIASSKDHDLVLLMSDGRGGFRRGPRFDEIARVPIAVIDEDPPYADGSGTAVLAEALKKGTVVWIRVPGADDGDRAVPAWYGVLDGKVYVLTGGSEQRIPGLAETDRAILTARSKDLQSRVADTEATARVVPSSDPLFAKVISVLLPRRLNLRDGDAAADRWRKECTLVELTPSGVPAEV